MLLDSLVNLVDGGFAEVDRAVKSPLENIITQAVLLMLMRVL